MAASIPVGNLPIAKLKKKLNPLGIMGEEMRAPLETIYAKCSDVRGVPGGGLNWTPTTAEKPQTLSQLYA